MHRCIDADLKRILKKNTFRLMFGIVLVAIIICIIAVFVRDKDKNAEFQLFLTRVAELNAMLIGIPVFLAIFADDFKSRAMQTAIGFGLSRDRLIICRFIEVVALTFLCNIVFTIVTFIMGKAGGISSDAINEALRRLWEYGALVSIAFSSLCIILVYIMQNATLGLVVYIIASSGVIDSLLALLNNIPVLKEHNIDVSSFLVEPLIDRAIDESRYYLWVVLAVGYVIIPLIISIMIFRKKELEF